MPAEIMFKDLPETNTNSDNRDDSRGFIYSISPRTEDEKRRYDRLLISDNILSVLSPSFSLQRFGYLC